MSHLTSPDLHARAARRRTQLALDGVTASYIHELTRDHAPVIPARARARRRGRPLALMADGRVAADRRVAA